MALMIDHNGYLYIGLRRDNRRIAVKVHHLVLEAFVGPRPGGAQSRHRNNDRVDNRVSNLVWGSAKENDADRRSFGMQKGERNVRAVLTPDQVRSIRRSPKSFRALARKFNVNPTTIARAANGTRWSHLKTATRTRAAPSWTPPGTVAEIRTRVAGGAAQAAVARALCVSTTTVSRIIRGLRWKYV
jgi:hypothetical protein